MDSEFHKNVDGADEVIEVPKLRSEIVNLGGTTVSFDTHDSDWRWSVDTKPLVGTEWCEARHIGYVLSGRLGVGLEDGTEFIC